MPRPQGARREPISPGRNTSERIVMSDTAFGRCANTRLPVCAPFSGMAAERPAAGAGNGAGEHTRTAGQDAEIAGARGMDPVAATYFEHRQHHVQEEWC
jgi:hypothetical protein